MISSLVTRTLRIRGSLLATVFMPSLQNDDAVHLDDATDHVQLPSSEPMVPREGDRFQPELAGPPLALDMQCGGSLQSKLVKKDRYGPAMPLIRGMCLDPPLGSHHAIPPIGARERPGPRPRGRETAGPPAPGSPSRRSPSCRPRAKRGSARAPPHPSPGDAAGRETGRSGGSSDVRLL